MHQSHATSTSPAFAGRGLACVAAALWLAASGCHRATDPAASLPDLQPAGHYSVRLEPELYGVLKVKSRTDDAAEVVIFGNVFTTRPETLGRGALHFSPDPRTGDWAREQATMRLDVLGGMQPVQLIVTP